MTKIMKKLSALFLTLALVFTMMPAIALSAFAEEAGTNVFNVYVNGVDTGKGVTREWLEENTAGAQIFPFPSGQGKNWTYAVAEGASFELVLRETIGAGYEDLSGAKINWNNAEGKEQGKFDLPVDMLAGAVTVFKLVDQNNSDITGSFPVLESGDDPIKEAKAVQLEGASDVIPVVATKQKDFGSYEEALAALNNGTWTEGASNHISPYVGGNLSDESQNYLKKDGAVKMGVFNFLGKFAMKDLPQMNIKMDAPQPVDMVFETLDAEPQNLTVGYSFDAEAAAGIASNLDWSSDNEAVAKVEAGKVCPAGEGTCTLTGVIPGTETTYGTINVTVKAGVHEAFKVFVNGVDTGKSITREWLEENTMGAQIFPFAGGEGKKWTYHIAEGPSYESVLKETLGAEFADLKGASIRWLNEEGAEQGKYDLPIDMLAGAVKAFKLVDQNGNDVTGGFNTEDFVDVKAVESGYPDVVPVVSFRQKEYKSYAAAEAALGTWTAEAGTDVSPYVGGNLTDGSQNYLKKNGKIDSDTFNFVGKFAMKNCKVLNVKIEPTKHTSSLTFTKTTAKSLSLKLTDKEIELLGGVKWTSSNTKVAAVDKNGKVTPKGIGTCKVTAKIANGAVVEECSVTVKSSAYKPSTPKSFKAVNVKTKSVKLTWKKVSNATGYEVYRSTKKSSGFKKVATIKKNSTVKYTNKKLKKGKKYYFKVRAYKTVNGKTVKGDYTSVKAVKIKK